MAQPSEKARLLAGALLLTAYTTQVQRQTTTDMIDVSTHNDLNNADTKAKAFIVGQDSSSGTFSGWMDVDTATANAGQFNLLANWKSSPDTPVTFAPSGLATGAECFLDAMNLAQFQLGHQIASAIAFSLSGQTDGASDPGVMLENITAISADGNGTARDGTAASSNGGVAHVHVTGFSGLTSNVVTIEHSVDGSTSWATLVTFATITGLTSERVVVAPGTTVRRYLRVVDNVTGTGSCTRAVAFARR